MFLCSEKHLDDNQRAVHSRTEDQVNGVNLGFASNQKIIESYKDENKFLHSLRLFWISLIYIYIYIYISLFHFFFGCLYGIKTQYLCGCFFSLGYGSCKLNFYFFWFFVFSLWKVFIIFYVNNNSKKSFQPHKVLTQLDGNHM